jgi:hypothetical protein
LPQQPDHRTKADHKYRDEDKAMCVEIIQHRREVLALHPSILQSKIRCQAQHKTSDGGAWKRTLEP